MGAPPGHVMSSAAASDRILMIEDDADQAALVTEYLGGFGMEVHTEGLGEAGLARLSDERFDALILDVGLPDLDGFEVCRRVRARSDLPIVMLTARGDDLDRILGLELGADDYLPKPFNPRELVARLRAVLRRRRGEAAGSGGVARFGRLEIDRDAREARVDGEPRELTSHQFALLCALADRPGHVLSRDDLMRAVRGSQLEAFDRSIDVHVSRIRAAIEDDPKKPRRVITVRGTGYVFARRQDD